MYANQLHSLYTERRSLPFLMARGLVGSTAMLLFYVGLQNTPLADAQTVFFLYPAGAGMRRAYQHCDWPRPSGAPAIATRSPICLSQGLWLIDLARLAPAPPPQRRRCWRSCC